MDVKFVNGRNITWDDSTYTSDQLSLTNNYDLGSTESRFWSATAAGFDGDNYYGQTMAPREVFLEYVLLASNASDRDDFIQTLKTAFNPSDGLGVLTVTLANGDERAIFAVPMREPTCLTGWTNRGSQYQLVQITLWCPQPFFLDPDINTSALSSFTGGLALPFTAPITLGSTNPSTTVTNAGNVPTPCTITFTGELVNPQITVLNSGGTSYIKVNTTVADGSYLRVNTAPGQHTVTMITGTTSSNAFQYLDPASFFFWLLPGSNTLTLTQTSAGANASASVEYYTQYIGV